MVHSQAEAKRFVVDRVVSQAQVERVPLSDAERKMLSWSESDPDFVADTTLAEQLASEMSDEDYEKKIAGLLARHFAAEVAARPEARSEWKHAAAVLREGDHYISIMLDDAIGSRLKRWGMAGGDVTSPANEVLQPAASGLLQVVLFAVALFGAVVVHLAFGVSLGIALLIFFVGWPLVGTLVTIDDDLPGGWSNPDGSVTPPWLEAWFWGRIVAGFAIAVAGAAIDMGWKSPQSLSLWFAAAAGAFLAAFLITRRWWLLLGTAIGVVALLIQIQRAG